MEIWVITFYFKKKKKRKPYFFRSLTFPHWSVFIYKTRHKAKLLIHRLSLHICLFYRGSLTSHPWTKCHCKPWLRSLLHMSLSSRVINSAHSLIFWFLQLLVDKRGNQNHRLDMTFFFFFSQIGRPRFRIYGSLSPKPQSLSTADGHRPRCSSLFPPHLQSP